MNNLKKILKKFSLKADMINIAVGIALIVSLIFIYQNPYNHYAILTACTAGGIMYMMLGLKIMKKPKQKTTGMTYIMMGLIFIGLGLFLSQYVKK